MNNERIFFNLSSEDGPFQVQLENPCIYDVDTEIGLISLILDKKYPQFLLVHIDNEPRKCVGLNEFELNFSSDEDVLKFLKTISVSEFFEDLLEEEKNINDGWAAL